MCDGSERKKGKMGKDEGVVASAESCFSVAWRFYLKLGGRGATRGNGEVDLEWSAAWRNRARMKGFGWREGRMRQFPLLLVLIEV